MRIPMIAGNWKMNTTVEEAIDLVKEMLPAIEPVENVEKVVCPPFVSLAKIRDVLKGSTVKLGAQNMYFEQKGAYTGEISPQMLSRLCDYVILGHSERRQYFNETNDVINKKIKAALASGIKPILCIGETLKQYEKGITEQVVSEQLQASLADIEITQEMVIAYEPIWAIGTGKAATSEQANDVIGGIRQIVGKLCDKDIAQGIRLLYGGSVNSANTTELLSQSDIDGALVGGASLKADQFTDIIKQTEAVMK